MSKLGKISADTTAFFLCDMQEKFRPVIRYFAEVLAAASQLVETSKLLNVPLIVTEQYPQGLGSTVQELSIQHAVGVFPKTKFSMLTPEVENFLNGPSGKCIEVVVLFGVEAHVCIEQTALDLISLGKTVHIVANATSSRSQEDRLLAFDRLRQVGCFISTCESVIFKLVQDKNHPQFSSVRQIVKVPTVNTGLAHL
ncbi:unnamed protein product [Ixodes hexagonus]